MATDEKPTADPKPQRVVRKAETVREKVEKTRSAEPKPRRLHKTTRRIAAPVRFAARSVGKLGRFKVFRIIGYILVPPYFRNSWKELRQVTWPRFRESWQLTFAVILFAVVFGTAIAVVDFGFDKVFKEILLK